MPRREQRLDPHPFEGEFPRPGLHPLTQLPEVARAHSLELHQKLRRGLSPVHDQHIIEVVPYHSAPPACGDAIAARVGEGEARRPRHHRSSGLTEFLMEDRGIQIDYDVDAGAQDATDILDAAAHRGATVSASP
ncbi:hypothetical protein [Rhodococcus sp. JS3073]|uniref:hypothetical protein n=1 Tax=Rhodococcus sp. JS3073 TaxID=3002901 RepID=UPI0022866FB4|nr:hypothetical protein [Rhodococcus sp. JS3073]WAM14599.1 hypothetical protein OYT95_35215 [Rhodococcus sp. JS3073]